MSNKINKPMMTSESLVAKMRDEKGITFKYVTEEKAEAYLTDINNYLRTAACIDRIILNIPVVLIREST
ncbi:MAG: hypothetical protein ACLRW4_02630 [Ruminococcus sp.]